MAPIADRTLLPLSCSRDKDWGDIGKATTERFIRRISSQGSRGALLWTRAEILDFFALTASDSTTKTRGWLSRSTEEQRRLRVGPDFGGRSLEFPIHWPAFNATLDASSPSSTRTLLGSADYPAASH
jgi:hypothetical protein